MRPRLWCERAGFWIDAASLARRAVLAGQTCTAVFRAGPIARIDMIKHGISDLLDVQRAMLLCALDIAPATQPYEHRVR